MRWIILLPLLAATACSAGWPSGSYEASITDSEATPLANAIADFVEEAVPTGTPIAVQAPYGSETPLDRALPIALHRGGIPESADGRRLTYVAQPVGDDGVMLRVTIDNSVGSQFFALHGFLVAPTGPMMVAQQ